MGASLFADKVLLGFVSKQLAKTWFCQLARITSLKKDSQSRWPSFGIPKISDFRGISWPTLSR